MAAIYQNITRTKDMCSCQAQCDGNTICYGYVFDHHANMCSLVSCNTSSGSVRFFFKRKQNTVSLISCVTVTTMSNIITSESASSTSSREQTTIKETTTEKLSTTKEQTASEEQHSSETRYSTMKHSTIEKLTTSKELSTTVTRLTTLTSSSNTMTTNETTQKAMNSTLCVCVCRHANQTVQESIDKRRRELILNKTELSFNIRKRTSAGDKRKTSRVVGTVAVIILVLYGLLFFCADILSLLAMCHSKMLNKNNQIEPNV